MKYSRLGSRHNSTQQADCDKITQIENILMSKTGSRIQPRRSPTIVDVSTQTNEHSFRADQNRLDSNTNSLEVQASIADVCPIKETQFALNQQTSIGKAASRFLQHSRKLKSVKFFETAHQAQVGRTIDSGSLTALLTNTLSDASQETLIMRLDQKTHSARASQTTLLGSVNHGEWESVDEPMAAKAPAVRFVRKRRSDASLHRTSDRFTAAMIPANHAKTAQNARQDFIDDSMSLSVIDKLKLYQIDWSQKIEQNVLKKAISANVEAFFDNVTPIFTDTSVCKRISETTEYWSTLTDLKNARLGSISDAREPEIEVEDTMLYWSTFRFLLSRDFLQLITSEHTQILFPSTVARYIQMNGINHLKQEPSALASQ